MQDIRFQIDLFEKQAKEHQHIVFKYFDFPLEVFHPAQNRDYTYAFQPKQRGGRSYYIPHGWKKFGLLLPLSSLSVFSSNSCVCFYTADIETVRQIAIQKKVSDSLTHLADYPSDPFAFVTPFIESLQYAGPPCSVPDDLVFELGKKTNYRVVVQCLVPSGVIEEVPNNFPYSLGSQNATWKVPSALLTPYAICIKQI